MEIKFRAKDVDSDMWHFGYYVKHDSVMLCVATEQEVKENENHYIMFDGLSDWNLPVTMLRADINPETLCQYVGLKDMNGKELYAYDVSLDERGRKWITYAAKGGFRTCTVDEWNETNGNPIICEGLSDLQNANWFEQTHVIMGNIFDNPELLME